MDPQREWFEKDYYRVLGIPANATGSEIHNAYRRLAKQLHPDINPGDEASEELFKQVTAAYDVLGDVDKREAYNIVHQRGPVAGGFGAEDPYAEDVDDEEVDIGDYMGSSQRHSTASTSKGFDSTFQYQGRTGMGRAFSHMARDSFGQEPVGNGEDDRSTRRAESPGSAESTHRAEAPGSAGGGGGSADFSQLKDRLEDLADLGNINAPRRKHGADLRTDLHLEFTEAVIGTTTSVSVTSDTLCQPCQGTGSEPGTETKRCTACKGSGLINDNQGMFSFSRPCNKCTGLGNVVVEPCRYCEGRGLVRSQRVVRLRTPPGVADGQTIKLKGQGGPGLNGGEPGDLYARVQVSPHQLFKREGKNLVLDVPITFAEAALGADIRVPRLDGSSVVIRVLPGATTGKRMSVRCKGADGQGSSDGLDMIIVLEVVVPESLSDEQRTAVEAFAAATHDNPRTHLGI